MKDAVASGHEIKEKRRAGAPIQGTGTSRVERSGGTDRITPSNASGGFPPHNNMKDHGFKPLAVRSESEKHRNARAHARYGCCAFRDKGIHERKKSHERCGTLPVWLVVRRARYIKGEGFFRVQRPADHDENYPLLERGHTWPGHPVGKTPKNAETWPRFAKTWSPEWENGGALRHATVGECSPGKYCYLPGFLQLPVRMGCQTTA
jgi:hypothetical protein